MFWLERKGEVYIRRGDFLQNENLSKDWKMKKLMKKKLEDLLT